jgi:hypothetical protein
MKVRVTRERAILFASILIIIILVALLFQQVKLLVALLIQQIKFPLYSLNYHGMKISFRINLRDAKDVKVYPSENAVRDEIMNQFVDNITIVYKPNESINSHYAVEVFEIVNKLAVAYRLKFGYIPNFNVVNVTSYENLTGSSSNPKIALVHPIYSNETSVRLDNHVIYIQGQNATSWQDQLKNFDLATVKFLMVALGIRI